MAFGLWGGGSKENLFKMLFTPEIQVLRSIKFVLLIVVGGSLNMSLHYDLILLQKIEINVDL